MLKLKMMLCVRCCRWSSSVAHQKAVCQSVREANDVSGVDNAASPRLADTAERDYFTLRERLITMQKQLEGTQKYGYRAVDRVAHIDGQLMQLL